MNRLLMAAAQGARIQYQYWDGWGDESDLECIRHSSYPLRVHPDDEHLMYGPISSAFRKAAVTDSYEMPDMLINVGIDFDDWLEWNRADDLTRSLWMLIMAEALAEEGV